MITASVVFLALALAFGSDAATSHRAPGGGEAQYDRLDGRGGEVLYNGIQLPDEWPPQLTEVPRDPVKPPYLAQPPAVIPIDVGRQLLVDDFLVEQTTLKRTFHLPTYHPASPVLRPDKPWEGQEAMPFSDGVWYDPADKLFKAWYLSERKTCYATSRNGIHWEKPMLDIQRGSNVVVRKRKDSSTVWLDLDEKDQTKRFKMFRPAKGGSTVEGQWGYFISFSADGIHWKESNVRTGACGDRSTVFYNPFRRVWVFSLRHGWGDPPRRRRYWESPSLETGVNWGPTQNALWWIGADSADLPRSDLHIGPPAKKMLREPEGRPQLYNLDATPYESLLVGLFSIWYGHPDDRQKVNQVLVGFSRDGWHWDRPDRRPFCPVSETCGQWNYSNVQSAGGGCLVVGDQLYFYVSGRAGEPGNDKSGVCSMGLATLRRDGFASLDATEAEGTLTTRPVRFSGKRLFVNAAVRGELRAEVLDQEGRVLAPFTRAACQPVMADTTKQELRWDGARDLAALGGKPVRFRFHLAQGSLYAFWVSADESGASHGYVAAGGLGYTGPRDE